jgi:translation initiation factor IF-3
MEALNMARELGLDLVEVAPNSDPPVCRIMDFGKMKYEQKKKDHRAKMKQHQVVLKEVRLRPKIDTHDRDVKINHAREFLEKGNKVQFTMMFKGREMAHVDLAHELFAEILAALQDVSKVESPARQQGRRITLVLGPMGQKH